MESGLELFPVTALLMAGFTVLTGFTVCLPLRSVVLGLVPVEVEAELELLECLAVSLARHLSRCQL